MIKIDSAIHSEQNCIAYKIGSEIIRNTCGGGEWQLCLIVALLKIKRNHTKNLKIYRDTTKLFPRLEYLSLEECSDYNESLAYRTHVVRLLGDMIIRDNAKWRFSGFLSLEKLLLGLKESVVM